MLRQAQERPAVLIRSTAPESSMMNRAVPSPFPSLFKHSVCDRPLKILSARPVHRQFATLRPVGAGAATRMIREDRVAR
jgi:hypothetical protein